MADRGGASEQEWVHVEFPDEEPDTDGVLWLDEEGVGGGDPAVLPPRAAPRRMLASLLALGVFLAGTASAAAAAYHRHLTDRVLADELVLHAAPGPPAIPGLAALGFATQWHAQVTEQVLVPVLNQGPRPVELLDAVLTEPGLVAAARLTPVGGRTLRPGETGELGGRVTVDCTVSSAAVAVSVVTFNGGTLTTARVPNLQVRARTSGGRTATSQLNPEGENPGLQERVCGQEGDEVTGPETLDTAADPRARTITVRLAMAANADIRVDYSASALYPDGTGHRPPGLVLSGPIARNPVAGTLDPGGVLGLTYVIDVRGCPSVPLPKTETLPETETLQLQLLYSVHGATLQATRRLVPLDPLIAEACGT